MNLNQTEKMMWFEIRCVFHLSFYFMVCECYNKYIVYWRSGISNAETRKLFDELWDLSVSSLDELIKTKEYKEKLNKYTPVHSAVLSENQRNIVQAFLQNGIDKSVREISGRDGHSYFIEVYYPELKKYRCWCRVPEEWSILCDMINMLVIDIANLDYQKYGCSVYKLKGEKL